MPTKYDILKQYYGYSSFRPGQEELIDAILSGRDALGIMPTGGGKSVCYQIPAMLLPGVTVVISPLISLMQDQVMALCSAGIPAAYVNSGLSGAQISQVYANLIAGKYKIVYVAPERLETEDFLYLASRLTVSLVAVDEAHCISQWGQDFRPSYLKIVSFLRSLRSRPTVAAFTATATSIVREDILRILELRAPKMVLTGFDRPNLHFSVLSGNKRAEQLLSLLKKRKKKSGIVYCNSRACVERVCEQLCRAGFAATRYHAGLSETERATNQEDFLYDRKTVMVATNAFGMGIDKSNVSYVIHYNLPLSIEAYYQEAGRAGRDGEAADCILFYSPSDLRVARMLIESGNENEALSPAERAHRLKQNYDRLEKMVSYCKTTDCLRGYILSYFGQAHVEKCGSCGNCEQTFRVTDLTVEAQMVLSCVARARNHLGYSVGKVLISHVLLSSRDHRITELGLDTLSTYGLMKHLPRDRVSAIIDRLVEVGCLAVNEHGGLELTADATPILRGEATFRMALKEEDPRQEKEAVKSSRRGKRRKRTTEDIDEQTLFDLLRNLRTEIARERNVPPYIIFDNAALTEMTEQKPCTRDELLEIRGVGEKKARLFGERFLDVIRAYIDQSENE